MAYILIAYLIIFLAQPRRKIRLLALLISLDIFLLSLLTCGKSRRNETISSCLWTMEQSGKQLGKIGRPTVDWLFTKLEHNHCETSYYVENKPELWGVQ